MYEYTVYMNGWTENEVYTVVANNESDAINQGQKLADAPFASLIEIELKGYNKMTTTQISYKELVNRLDVAKLFNKAPELDPEIYDNIINGSLWYNEDEEEDDRLKDIFQWYLISRGDAEYLKNTDELVFYSDVLDEYVWGVTHFGTPWTDVTLEIREG